jgi:outer membrane protein assembly factor BamB
MGRFACGLAYVSKDEAQMSGFGTFLARILASMVLLSVCSAAFPMPAQDVVSWNQWRGPSRTGESPGDAWPERIDDAHLEKVWSIPLQPSYSGPVVWGDRVFTTETVDKKFERVTAVDRATGQTLWTQQWDGAMSVPFFARSNGSWIRSTPACDGKMLFVGGMCDLLVALDVATGKVLWQIDFVAQLNSPLPTFGFVCSPLLDGDSLYVQAGGALVKVKKEDGSIIWQTLSDGGGMNGSAFSSPTLETIGGKRQLLVQTRTQLAGVDPDDGAVLWTQEVPAYQGMNILTPTVWQDLVFTSSYGGRSFLYQPSVSESGWSVQTTWENKAQGYMSSPIVHEGHLYLHLRNGRFMCLNLATGEECWTTQPFGKYWSMIKQGDRILALDQRGELLLIRANPESFELLDRRTVSEEEAWAHLANDGDQLLVRDLDGLTAYRWVKASGG